MFRPNSARNPFSFLEQNETSEKRFPRCRARWPVSKEAGCEKQPAVETFLRRPYQPCITGGIAPASGYLRILQIRIPAKYTGLVIGCNRKLILEMCKCKIGAPHQEAAAG